jgi:hypothetical protein
MKSRAVFKIRAEPKRARQLRFDGIKSSCNVEPICPTHSKTKQEMTGCVRCIPLKLCDQPRGIILPI